MIKERYCSFKISKLLKEKGFDEPCRSIYIDCGDYIDFYYSKEEQTDIQIGVWEVLRPTHQMALDYLREKHNILIWFSPVIPIPIPKDETVFYWEWNLKKKLHSYPRVNSHIKYKTPEEAVEEALKYCLTELI